MYTYKMITADEIKRLVERGASYQVDFKAEVLQNEKEITEIVCSFANTLGGYVLIGIDNQGIINGAYLDNYNHSSIQESIGEIYPTLHCKLYSVNIEGKDVWVIDVPSGRHTPYFFNGNVFVRESAKTQKLTKVEEVWELFKQSEKIYYDSIPCKYDIHKNLDHDLIKSFRREAHISNNIDNVQLLENLQVFTENNDTKRGAVLFFSQRPEELFFHAVVRCVQFKGINKRQIIDDKIFGGTLVAQYKKALSWIQDKLKVKYEIKDTEEKIEKWDIPLDALREALINAITHRDYYEQGAFINVEVYDDRVEINNPGGLLPLVAKKFGRKSLSRNPYIFNLFMRMNLVEHVGSGIGRMQELMINAGLPAPEYETTDFFTIILHRKNYVNISAKFSEIKKQYIATEKKSLNNKPHAKNSSSPSCGIPCTAYSTFLKTNYLPSLSAPVANLILGAFVDNKMIENSDVILDFYDQWGLDVTDTDTLLQKLQDINTSIHKKESLSKEDLEFSKSLASSMLEFLAEANEADLLKAKVADMQKGQHTKVSNYQTFKKGIPARYRREIITQIVGGFIATLDSYQEEEAFKNFTRQEILNFNFPGRGKIIDEIFSDLMEDAIANLEEAESKGTITKDQQAILNNLRNDPNLWVSIVNMASDLLFEAEHLKIDAEFNQVFDIEDEDLEVLNPEDNNGNIRSAEETGREHWQLKSDTISAFNSLSKEVRSVLYKLVEDGKTGVLGFYNMADAMYMHEKLMGVRSLACCTNSDEFIEQISKIKEDWAHDLAYYLKRDPYKRSLFFTTYKKNVLHYVYHSKKKTKYTKTYYGSDGKIINNINDFVTFIYREVSGINQLELTTAYIGEAISIDPTNTDCIFNTDGYINDDKLTAFLQVIDTLKVTSTVDKYFDLSVFGTGRMASALDKREPTAEQIRGFMLYINDSLNLHMDSEEISKIMNSPKLYKDYLDSVFKLTQELATKKRLLTGNMKDHINDILKKSDYKYLKKALVKLLNTQAKVINVDEKTSPIEKGFRYNQSTYMAHTIPNYIGDTLEMLLKHAQQGSQSLRKFIETTYFDCPLYADQITENGQTKYVPKNALLEMLYNATEKELNDPMSAPMMFLKELTRGLGNKDRVFENFTEADNFIFTLNEYMQKWMATKTDPNAPQYVTPGYVAPPILGVVPLFVTGDSNSTRYLTIEHLGVKDILNRTTDLALTEIERMSLFKSFTEYCEQYDLAISNGHEGARRGDKYYKDNPLVKNADKFSFLPFLNDITEFKVTIEKADKTTKTVSYPSIMAAYNELVVQNKDIVTFKTALSKVISDSMASQYDAFIHDLQDKGIVMQHVCKINNDKLFVADPHNKYTHTLKEDMQFLQEYYYNQRFYMMQQLQMFTVDPAFFNGTNDLQKRYKAMISTGEVLDLTAIDPTTKKLIDDNNGNQTVIYFNEIRRNSEVVDPDYIEALKQAGFDSETIGKYTENTLTDGQGYRSFKSYRKLMVMSGRWNEAAEEVYQMIMKNRDLGYTRLSREQLQRIDKLGVTFQPLKPLYFGVEKVELENGRMLHIPVFHKYSEFPLIAELLPEGSKLEKMGRVMDAKSIDLATCTTTVKVGGYGSVNIDDCNTTQDFRNAFGNERTHHTLPLTGWRLQTNVPQHVDVLRGRGTQWLKHGYGSMEGSQPKRYSFLKRFKEGVIKLTKSGKSKINLGTNRELNQEDMVKLYGALGSAGFIQSSIKLTTRLSSPSSQAEALAKIKAMDARGSQDGLLAYNVDENGEFYIAPSEGLAAADNIASLLSTLRKEVVKQGMRGGSCVQVSAYGMDHLLRVHTEQTAEGKTNIVYADCARTFDYSINTKDGKTVKLDYFEFVDHNTGMLLDENNQPVEPADADNQPGHEYYGWNTKMGKLYPGILDCIAYRIPTEKDYSIINLKARRFFHKSQGGIMMVPSQFTTIAGFDFDIDKLYFVQRDYTFGRAPISYEMSKNEMWKSYFENDPLGETLYYSLLSEHAKAIGKNMLDREAELAKKKGLPLSSEIEEIDNKIKQLEEEENNINEQIKEDVDEKVNRFIYNKGLEEEAFKLFQKDNKKLKDNELRSAFEKNKATYLNKAQAKFANKPKVVQKSGVNWAAVHVDEVQAYRNQLEKEARELKGTDRFVEALETLLIQKAEKVSQLAEVHATMQQEGLGNIANELNVRMQALMTSLTEQYGKEWVKEYRDTVVKAERSRVFKQFIEEIGFQHLQDNPSNNIYEEIVRYWGKVRNSDIIGQQLLHGDNATTNIPEFSSTALSRYIGNTDLNVKDNYVIWSDYYQNDPVGKIMYEYLLRAYEEDFASYGNNHNLSKQEKKQAERDLYTYWDRARKIVQMETKQGTFKKMPLSAIPETASEAFEKFLYTRKTSKGEFKYIELTSKYNEKVPLLEQTQEAINNLLFDFYQARLEDYDTFKERYTPGGPTQLKEALPIMMALNYATDEELANCVRRETQGALEALLDLAKKYKGFTPNYDPTEPATLAHYQTYNAIYDKLIGVAANQNINQRLTALLSVMRLKSPIQFGSILEAKDKDKAGSDVKARVVNGIDTELLNTEFLSSAVDAVKNALLEYYGIDDNNFNMACLLSKIGASPTDIGLLLNQPVVKKAMLIMKESDYYMSLSDALAEALQSPEFMGVEAYRTSIATLNTVFSSTEGAGKTKEARNKHVTSDALANHIAYSKKVPNIKSPEHEAYLKGQAAVVHLLSEINGAASELSDVIKISKATSANSIQATLGAFEAAQKAIEQFEANFGGPNSMFEVEINGQKMWDYDSENNTWKKKYGIGLVSASLGFYDLNSAYDLLDQVLANPFCIEQVAFAAQAHFINTVIDSLFPYRSQGFMAVKNAMSALTKKGTLPAELITTLNRDLMAAFMEYICPEMSGSAMENVLMPDGSTVQVERRIFYQQFFPYFYNMLMTKNAKEVAESKTKFSPDQNPVMPYIAFAILRNIKKVNDVQIRGVDSATGLGHLLLKFTGSSMLKKHQVDMMIDSWEQLYFSGDPMLKQLAEQLAHYSIFNKGFGYGELSFLRFAPVMLKKNLAGGAYAKFFNRVFNLKEGDEPGTLTIAQTGSNSSTTIRIKDIMKSFILNNSNEYQFTRQYLNDRLFESIATHTPGGYELRDAFDATSAKAISKEEFSQRIKSFTVDLNNEDIKKNGGNSLAVTILDEDGEVVGYKFTPCIKIGDAIYICDINLNGNDTEFTTSGNGKITYYKMDLPLGKDYSKPGLYGTREAHIKELSNNNQKIMQQILNIAQSKLHSQKEYSKLS